MNGRIFRRVTLWLITGLVILSCASPVLITPPPSAPPSGQSSSIETIIVQTAVAAQTQTAIVLPPTRTATSTPLPTRTATITPTATPTVLFLFLTETSSPEELFDLGEGNDEGGDSGPEKPVVLREWDCRVISRSPAEGTVIRRDSVFRAIWTVENTGTKTWPKKGVDIVYQSGAHLHQAQPYYDIPSTVGPGGKVTITISLLAPKRPNTYSTRWSLQVGRTEFCGVRFVIEVQ